MSELPRHTFKPQMHYIAHYTCPHLRRYVEWSGREWASKTGPTFGRDWEHTRERYEHVE